MATGRCLGSICASLMMLILGWETRQSWVATLCHHDMILFLLERFRLIAPFLLQIDGHLKCLASRILSWHQKLSKRCRGFHQSHPQSAFEKFPSLPGQVFLLVSISMVVELWSSPFAEEHAGTSIAALRQLQYKDMMWVVGSLRPQGMILEYVGQREDS